MLSGALDDRGADLAELLRTLTEDVGLAVPSFLGLSVSLLVGGDALGWTAMIEPHAGHEIGTSARLPLVALGRVEESSEIVFYAGTPGGFVDLAADVSFVLGIDPSTVVLDDDLIPPEHSGGVSGLADVSLVNQAVGALIDRMGGAEAARAELGRLADTGRHSVLQAAIEVVRSTAAPPRSRREILRDLAASAPDLLLAIDIDGRILFAGEEIRQLFGWSDAELVGQPIDRLISQPLWDQDQQLHDAFLSDATNRSTGTIANVPATRRDGSQFIVDVRLRPFRAAEGPVVCLELHDPSRVPRPELPGAQSDAAATEVLLGIDARDRIAFVEEGAEALFGWSAADLVGTPLREVVAAVPGGAVTAQRKDGTSFPAAFTARPVNGQDGVVSVATVRHADARLADGVPDSPLADVVPDGVPPVLALPPDSPTSELRTERLQRMEILGDLAGGVAHDFNNLLGVIQNYGVLLRRQVTAPRALADLEEIRVATERAAVLTRQLLMFSHSGDVVHGPLELNEVIRRAASLLERTLGGHIQLHLELAEGPVLVLADAQEIEQVVLNLALNARDAMPAGGLVTIRTSSDSQPGSQVFEHPASANAPDASPAPDTVTVQVIDEGHGMAPSVLTRAFEPFFTTKVRGEGTGLGLASVKGIVRRSGGSVSIASTVGQGTTVTFALRRVPAAAPVPDELGEAAPGGDETILLVEDETSLRQATARILTDHGYQVVAATDGVEALVAYDEAGGNVDLVLSDIAMPRMRGDELARILALRGIAVPVVLITGFDFGDAPSGARQLTKPVAEETLLRAIRAELDGKE